MPRFGEIAGISEEEFAKAIDRLLADEKQKPPTPLALHPIRYAPAVADDEDWQEARVVFVDPGPRAPHLCMLVNILGRCAVCGRWVGGAGALAEVHHVLAERKERHEQAAGVGDATDLGDLAVGRERVDEDPEDGDEERDVGDDHPGRIATPTKGCAR